MSTPSMFGLIALRQFLQASGRLFGILWKSDPWNGWPVLRAFLDTLERISQDAHAETVAPALADLLRAIEAKSPGVIDAVLSTRHLARGPDRGPLENTPGTTGRG